ncbi:MAG: 3-hydroxyacyl-[acyl-carrier-protein] dehydratase FabZ [Chromatiales bacterium 21-64-14]|nr:MAG: 3-hydroxyacyl-[acyl-carrier-protein] dehydratase FabZ [Chromatiales bacterium 21-64-14]HQU15133.1 3-hydroxyacyl-ACP dehydratase FabZ [Gammaproteobacteria bacterium]
MDIQAVMRHLPHRYPFLLVDRVIACVPSASLTAVKNVTINEPFFQGHFPERPVMPGVLILEAMAQATGILAFESAGRRPENGSIYLLVGVDHARFRRPVVPGDQLLLEVVYKARKRNMMRFSVDATVDGVLVANAELMCAAKEVAD